MGQRSGNMRLRVCVSDDHRGPQDLMTTIFDHRGISIFLHPDGDYLKVLFVDLVGGTALKPAEFSNRNKIQHLRRYMQDELQTPGIDFHDDGGKRIRDDDVLVRYSTIIASVKEESLVVETKPWWTLRDLRSSLGQQFKISTNDFRLLIAGQELVGQDFDNLQSLVTTTLAVDGVSLEDGDEVDIGVLDNLISASDPLSEEAVQLTLLRCSKG